jgi:hypothetical protein
MSERREAHDPEARVEADEMVPWAVRLNVTRRNQEG